MRYVLLVLIALTLIGCGKQGRAQAGADAAAGLNAVRMKLATMEAGYATAEAIAILTGVEKYIPAATGVNPAEWPAPRMTPEQIVEDPSKFHSDAPPVPEPWGAQLWSAAVLAGGLAAWLLKRGLPLIPGIGGPARALIEMGADVLWKVAATKDQKALDAALIELQRAARVAAPVIELIVSQPSNLEEQLRTLLKSDDVVLALLDLSRPGNLS